MARVTTAHWAPVERWGATLFLIGGGLMLGHAGLLGIQAFSTVSTPPDVFGPTGHLVALVGLFGLYPVLADRTPAVARVAGAVVAVAVGAWSLLATARILTVAGVLPSVEEVLPAAVFLLAFASTILTYGLFGAAILRVESGSRVVGLLLLTPGALILVALAGSAVAGLTALSALVIGAGLALSMLALGYTLRTWDHPAGHGVASGGTAVG